jgi:adenine-specific DNA-methyltransferase
MKNEPRTVQSRRLDELENELTQLRKKIASYETLNLKQNRYGLLWIDIPEAFEDDVENKLPILEEVPRLAINGKTARPSHLLIEGDNYHALTCLNYTHKGKINVIYIDPPYNTGSDGFRYKDKRIMDRFPDGTEVPSDHPLRHSYWLSFMRKRLELAKDLLVDNGVIFMSIDDNEAAQLKLLADSIFDNKNFVAQFIWEAGRKNDSKLVSVSHEYILCYVKSIDTFRIEGTTWRIRKDGLELIYKTYEKLKKKHKNNYLAIEKGLKAWYASLSDSAPAKDHSHYNHVDKDGIYFAADISWPGGGGPKYKVLHPKTKKPCKIPARGWMFASPQRMGEVVAENHVHFGPDEKSVPCIKSYLKDKETQVPSSVFYQDGRAATKRLRETLGADLFSNPKDENILARLINFSSQKDAVVLDFFAGSGSTAHAVMKLNDIDGGNRQFILITNNEGKIMSDVCYPRIKKLMKGDKKLTGFGDSLKYYKNAFVGKHNIIKADDNDKIELAHRAGGMLAIAEGTLNEIERNDYWQIFGGQQSHTAIYFREELDKFGEFMERVVMIKGPTSVYVFSWEREMELNEFDGYANITVKTIPQPILEMYRQIYNLV